MSKALLLKDRRGEWAVFDCPYNRDDITLYLDAPGELYDFFEEQLFDFFAR